MRKSTIAALFVMIAGAVAPQIASAQTDRTITTQQVTGNPMDANARDASTYGGQSATIKKRMSPRSGHRMRMMHSSRMMHRHGMMHDRRMMHRHRMMRHNRMMMR